MNPCAHWPPSLARMGYIRKMRCPVNKAVTSKGVKGLRYWFKSRFQTDAQSCMYVHTHEHTCPATHIHKQRKRDQETQTESICDLYHGQVDYSEVDITYFIVVSQPPWYFSILKLENLTASLCFLWGYLANDRASVKSVRLGRHTVRALSEQQHSYGSAFKTWQ